MALKLVGQLSDEEIAKRQVEHTQKSQSNKVAKNAAELKANANVASEDAKKIAKAEKDALQAENKILSAQISQRKAYLAKPLTEDERVELQHLKAMANSGKNPDRTNMIRMSDLRKKAKNKE